MSSVPFSISSIAPLNEGIQSFPAALSGPAVVEGGSLVANHLAGGVLSVEAERQFIDSMRQRQMMVVRNSLGTRAQVGMLVTFLKQERSQIGEQITALVAKMASLSCSASAGENERLLLIEEDIQLLESTERACAEAMEGIRSMEEIGECVQESIWEEARSLVENRFAQVRHLREMCSIVNQDTMAQVKSEIELVKQVMSQQSQAA